MLSVKLVIQANKNKEEYKALISDAFSLAEPDQKPTWQGCLSVQFIRVPSQIREQVGRGRDGSGGTNRKCPSQFLRLLLMEDFCSWFPSLCKNFSLM